MFTGIIERVGAVEEISPTSLTVSVQDNPRDWVLGESVAVNGCCLTVVEDEPYLRFDLSLETWRRTAFERLGKGSPVNLERAMRPTDRFGGHIVQGHVDATGVVSGIEAVETGQVFEFQVPSEFDRYLIDKGSVALEGISLTVVHPENGSFQVWVIPHTLSHTNLGSLRVGDPINVEFDVMARHLEKLLSSALGRPLSETMSLAEARDINIQALPNPENA